MSTLPRLLQAPTTELRRWQVALVVLALTIAVSLGGAAAPAGAALPIVASVLLGALVLALTNLWYGAIATVCTVVLLPTPFSADIGGVTVTIGRLVLFTLLIGWLIQRQRGHGRTWPTPLDPFLWIVVAAMLAACIVNLPSLSNAELAAVVRRVSLFVVDFFLLYRVVGVAVGSRERAVRFVRIVTGLLTFVAALGIVERFTGRNVFEYLAPVLPAELNRTIAQLAEASILTRGAISRAHSTIEQPLGLAVLLLIALPLAAAFATAGRTTRERLGWSVAALVIGAALLATASRGAYLILVPLTLTLVLLAPDRSARRALAIAAVVLAGIGMLDGDVRTTMSVYLRDLATGERTGASVENRTAAFGATLALLEDRPLFGFAPGTFSAEQLRQNELISTDVANPVLDNAYLEFAAGTGAVGIVTLAALLFAAWLMTFRLWRRSSSREDRLLAAGLLAAVQSWILFAFVADVYVFNAPPRVFFALLGAVAVLYRDVRPEPSPADAAVHAFPS